MPATQTDHDIIRATDVVGTEVYLGGGERFGHVQDVFLSKSANRILFAVVGREGAATATPNFYAVPWADLDYDTGKSGYRLGYGTDAIKRHASGSSVLEVLDKCGLAER